MADLGTKVILAQSYLKAARKLAADGLRPDVIVAHPGWGESLFLKEVWPQARLAIYCEFLYTAAGADVGLDPEFPGPAPSDEPAPSLNPSVNTSESFTTASIPTY